MKFDVICTENLENGAKIRKFVYDNETSEILDEDGNFVFQKPDEPKFKGKAFPLNFGSSGF